MSKDEGAFRTIGEVSEALAVPQHVLRFWEARFPQVSPLKRGGNRRYYRPDEVALLSAIRRLLYDDGYTIKGVQRLLRTNGARAVVAVAATTPDQSQPVETRPRSETPDPTVAAKAEARPVPADAIAALAAEVESCARALEVARHAAA